MSQKTLALGEACLLALLLYFYLVPGEDGMLPTVGQDQAPRQTEAPLGTDHLGKKERPDLPSRQRQPLTRIESEEVLLFGKVTDEQGNLLDNCQISLRGEDPEMRMSYNRTRSWQGEYGLLLPHHGTWEVRCFEENLGEIRSKIAIPLGCHRHRLDLQIDRSLLVHVEFQDLAGKPFRVGEKLDRVFKGVPGGRLLLAIATKGIPTDFWPYQLDRRTLSYGCGRWIPRDHRFISLSHLGKLVLFKPPPVQVSAVLGSSVLATQPVTPGQGKVVFKLDPRLITRHCATIKVRLVEASTGKGLSELSKLDLGFGLTWENGKIGFGVVCLERRYDCFVHLTDSVYHSGPLPLGTTTVRFCFPELERVEKQVDLTPGQVLDLGEIQLDKAKRKTISCTVEDSVGKPVDGRVDHLYLDQFVPGRTIRTGSHSFTGGAFRLSLPPGSHLLAARKRSRDKKQVEYGQLVVKVGDTPVDALTIQTRPASRVILRNQSSRTGSCTFSIYDQQKTPLWAGIVPQGNRDTIWLLPGYYTITVHRGGKVVAEKPITLVGGYLEVTWPW